MDLHSIAQASCCLIPLMALILMVLTMSFYLNLMNINKRKILTVLLAIALIFSSILLYSFHKYYIKMEPYKGHYHYNVLVIYSDNNGLIMKLDLPLPHDQSIYSNLTFYELTESDLRRENHYYWSRAKSIDHMKYTNYTITNSQYGRVLHIQTKRSLFIHSNIYDSNNTIKPDLHLSTQNGDVGHIKYSGTSDSNISVNLFYLHYWPIGYKLDDYRDKGHYLSIAAKPYVDPREVLDYGEYSSYDNFHINGLSLSNGWNTVNITEGKIISQS